MSSPRPTLRRTLGCFALALAFPGCNDQGVKAPDRKAELYHDFGLLELGQSRTHDFVVPIPETAEGSKVVPQSYQGNCSCATGMVMIKKPDGRSKAVFGLPIDERTLEPGDSVILRLTLKTAGKEPVDIARSEEVGHVGFKHIYGDFQRHSVERIRFHFGIRSPIKCSPMAHIEFGELPMSNPPFVQTIDLTSNIAGRELTLGRPFTSHDCIAADLQNDGDGYRLKVTITPYSDNTSAPKIQGAISMVTGQKDYPNLVILVSGTFIGDIQFQPSFVINMDRFPFDKPKKRFLNIIDHNRRRPKGFVVHSLENANGTDISEHFEITFESLLDRKTRVWVNYLGTMGGNSLRGWLSLSKRQGEEPVAKIRIIGHNRNVKVSSK